MKTPRYTNFNSGLQKEPERGRLTGQVKNQQYWDKMAKPTKTNRPYAACLPTCLPTCLPACLPALNSMHWSFSRQSFVCVLSPFFAPFLRFDVCVSLLFIHCIVSPVPPLLFRHKDWQEEEKTRQEKNRGSKAESTREPKNVEVFKAMMRPLEGRGPAKKQEKKKGPLPPLVMLYAKNEEMRDEEAPDEGDWLP